MFLRNSVRCRLTLRLDGHLVQLQGAPIVTLWIQASSELSCPVFSLLQIADYDITRNLFPPTPGPTSTLPEFFLYDHTTVMLSLRRK
jgi:hypothetical protein